MTSTEELRNASRAAASAAETLTGATGHDGARWLNALALLTPDAQVFNTEFDVILLGRVSGAFTLGDRSCTADGEMWVGGSFPCRDSWHPAPNPDAKSVRPLRNRKHPPRCRRNIRSGVWRIELNRPRSSMLRLSRSPIGDADPNPRYVAIRDALLAHGARVRRDGVTHFGRFDIGLMIAPVPGITGAHQTRP